MRSEEKLGVLSPDSDIREIVSTIALPSETGVCSLSDAGDGAASAVTPENELVACSQEDEEEEITTGEKPTV